MTKFLINITIITQSVVSAEQVPSPSVRWWCWRISPCLESELHPWSLPPSVGQQVEIHSPLDPEYIHQQHNGCIHNQKSNPSRLVRRDRSSPMKKNALVRFISVTYTITSLYTIIPQSLWLAIWNWLMNAYVTCVMGVAYKNLAWKSDFLSEASEQIWIWLWTWSVSLGLIFDYECNQCHTLHTSVIIKLKVRLHLKRYSSPEQVISQLHSVTSLAVKNHSVSKWCKVALRWLVQESYIV